MPPGATPRGGPSEQTYAIVPPHSGVFLSPLSHHMLLLAVDVNARALVSNSCRVRMPEHRAVGTGWAAGAFTEAAEGEVRSEAATAEGSAAAGSAKERMSAQVASDHVSGEGSMRAHYLHMASEPHHKLSQNIGPVGQSFFPGRTWCRTRFQ